MDDQDKIELGKQITFGLDYFTFVLPNKETVRIGTMGMNDEMLFINLFEKFTTFVGSTKSEVVNKFADVMGGTSKAQFGLVEGLNMVSGILVKFPEVQAMLVDCVMLILKANDSSTSEDYIRTKLSTAQCFTIISKAAEVQGLVASFRQLAAGLNPAGSGQ